MRALGNALDVTTLPYSNAETENLIHVPHAGIYVTSTSGTVLHVALYESSMELSCRSVS